MRTLLALLFLLIVPASAAAAPADLGRKTDSVDVVMTSDGAAHVAYVAPRASLADPVVFKVCRIPAGETTCTETASLSAPVNASDDASGPWIVSDGTKVVLVFANQNGAQNRTFASVSTNGTAAYSAATQVANITATDVALSPTGDRLWISASQGLKSAPNSPENYLAFASAPLTGPATNGGVLGSASGGRSIDGLLVGITPDLMPSHGYFKPFNGDPTAPTDVNDAAKWGAPVDWDLGDPFERNGGYKIGSAPGRMWVAYKGLQSDVVVRPFTNGAFGGAVAPDCASRFSSGLQGPPDVAISRTNELLVTEVGSDGTNMRLAYFHGNADGTAFSPYQELQVAPSIQDIEIAADPTSDSGGVIAWTTDDIHADQGELFFTRLPAAATAPCVKPGVTPTPTPTVTATPTPTPKPTQTATASISGAKLTLTLPNLCLNAGKKYKVKLAVKKPKKAKLKKIVKVVFSATGNKAKKDKKRPYSVSFTVPKNATKGKKITIKAKVTVKVKGKKKARTKTVKGSFVVC